MLRLLVSLVASTLLVTMLLSDDKPAAKSDRADRLKAIREEHKKASADFNNEITAGKIKPNEDGDYPGWDDLRKRFVKKAHEVIDADPADAVGFEALLFCLTELSASEFEPDLYQLVAKHHIANEKIDPLIRRGDASVDFLRTVTAKSPYPKHRLWASFHLAAHLYEGGKSKEAEPLLVALEGNAEAKELGGYSTGNTLADNATRQLFEIRRLNIGQEAPEIVGPDLDKKPMALSDSRGKVTLLVFWATWCGPCMDMVPHERALTEHYICRPFVVVGINGDTLPIGKFTIQGADGKAIDHTARVKAAIEKHKMTWRSFAEGQFVIAPEWNVRSWPRVYLIDHNGIIRGKWSGDPGKKELDAAIEKLVKLAETDLKKPGK